MSVGLVSLLSAVVGAVAALIFAEWRESRQRGGERAGLARLILGEMERNSPERDEPTVMIREQTATEDGQGVTQEVVFTHTHNPPKLDAWREARARLAQLLDPQDFDLVAHYYRVLQKMADDAEPYRTYPQREAGAQVFHSQEPSWKERTEDVQARLQRYAEPGPRQTWLGV